MLVSDVFNYFDGHKRSWPAHFLVFKSFGGEKKKFFWRSFSAQPSFSHQSLLVPAAGPKKVSFNHLPLFPFVKENSNYFVKKKIPHKIIFHCRAYLKKSKPVAWIFLGEKKVLFISKIKYQGFSPHPQKINN